MSTLTIGQWPKVTQIKSVQNLSQSVYFNLWSSTEYNQTKVSEMVYTDFIFYSPVSYQMYPNLIKKIANK